MNLPITTQSEKGNSMKALVIYYSFEGNTEFIANTIAETLKITTVRIHPVKDLTSTGFSKYVWGGGQVVMKIKPKLEPINVDFQAFDVIFLGSPIWAGTYAPPIKTLLEDGIFKNKKVYYFYTHQGGAQNAEIRAEKIISKYNQYASATGFIFVLENQEECRKKAIEWALECKSKVEKLKND
jgi:flavodoxin